MSDFKKRYSFRLSEEDREIYEFLETSKETNSETIRKLLKFALNQINQEKEKKRKQQEYVDLKNELKLIKEQQNEGFQEILDRLNNGIIVQNENQLDDIEDEEKAKVEKSLENSIDSMLDSFGMFD